MFPLFLKLFFCIETLKAIMCTSYRYSFPIRLSLARLLIAKGWRTNIFTRSKGLAAIAAKTECTKIILGS